MGYNKNNVRVFMTTYQHVNFRTTHPHLNRKTTENSSMCAGRGPSFHYHKVIKMCVWQRPCFLARSFPRSRSYETLKPNSDHLYFIHHFANNRWINYIMNVGITSASAYHRGLFLRFSEWRVEVCVCVCAFRVNTFVYLCPACVCLSVCVSVCFPLPPCV